MPVRLRVEQQLFVSYLVLIALVTVTLSFGAGSVLRAHLMQTVEDDLRRELALARQAFETLRGEPYDSIADLLGELSERRITLITASGVALGESAPVDRHEPPSDYLSRPEVRTAAEEGFGRAVRYSATLGAEHLYLALRTDGGEIIRAAVPLSEIDLVVSEVRRQVLLVAGLAVLIAVLFSLGFSLLVTRPLRQMVAVARALGSGELSRRVRVAHEGDLGDLGTALNTLASELQRRLGQLERERIETQTLIDSMSEAVLAVTETGELRRSNPAARRIFGLRPDSRGIQLETISRHREFLSLVRRAIGGEPVPASEIEIGGRQLLGTAHPLPQGGGVLVFLDVSELRRLEGVRRDFVANASHELKTPLTAIRGYSETLLDPDLPRDLALEFAETVKQNADRLQRIVDDLLDLSRIEAGGWRVRPESVDVERIARDVWSAERPAGAESDHDFDVEIAPGAEVVTADPAALRQILANLYSNARRHTPAGGRIRVVATRTSARPPMSDSDGRNRGDAASAWIRIEVTDSGSGIPGAHIPRIFERFYRADPARSREAGGTGLGLAIVRHLVEAHGGWIEAESELGRGTTIRFSLPLDPTPATCQASPAGESVRGSDSTGDHQELHAGDAEN